MKPLTKNQQEVLDMLAPHVGKTVQVLTSQYHANVSPHFKPVGFAPSAALRGLASRGYIELQAYWKGATVKVLRASDEPPARTRVTPSGVMGAHGTDQSARD